MVNKYYPIVAIFLAIALVSCATPASPAASTTAPSSTQPTKIPAVTVTPTNPVQTPTPAPNYKKGIGFIPAESKPAGVNCRAPEGGYYPPNTCLVSMRYDPTLFAGVVLDEATIKSLLLDITPNMIGWSVKIPKFTPLEEYHGRNVMAGPDALSPAGVNWPEDWVEVTITDFVIETYAKVGQPRTAGIVVFFNNSSLAARMGEFRVIAWPTIRETDALSILIGIAVKKNLKQLEGQRQALAPWLKKVEVGAIPVVMVVAGVTYLVLTLPVPDPGDPAALLIASEGGRRLVQVIALSP